MSNQEEMEEAQAQIGIMDLPEVFYGQNYFFVANKQFNILLSFNAIHSLSFSSYENRNQFLNPKTGVNYFKANLENEKDK